jgi:hypothetical protein
MDPETEYHVLDCLSKTKKPRLYCNLHLPLVYVRERPVAKERHKDIMDLLSYTPLIDYEYF